MQPQPNQPTRERYLNMPLWQAGLLVLMLIGLLTGSTAQVSHAAPSAVMRTSQHDPKDEAIRRRLVRFALWGVNHNAEITYAQTRPMQGINHPRMLPLRTDCSGFITLVYKWSLAPDPNGQGFNGYGYTGTLLSHMRHIRKDQIREGDLVVWDRTGTGEHVAIVVNAGNVNNPILVSHGSNAGPITIRFSDLNNVHRGASVVWLTLGNLSR